jgi:hypothetical protein
MIEINLAVELWGQIPNWQKVLHSSVTKSSRIPKGYIEPKYRIYINDNLITERSWTWENNILLDENIWIYGEHDTDYILHLESIVFVPEQAVFKFSNFRGLNHNLTLNSIEDTVINFKTHKYNIEELANEN